MNDGVKPYKRNLESTINSIRLFQKAYNALKNVVDVSEVSYSFALYYSIVLYNLNR